MIDKSEMIQKHLQRFSLFSKGFTNLLGLKPFSNPAPNPLILLLPKAPTVSVLPVKILSLAITNSRQLSLFNCSFFCFSTNTGDLLKGEILSLNSSISSYERIDSGSTISYSYLKYGWLNACSAVILSSGFIFNIFLRRSIGSSSHFSYNGSSKSKLHDLF